MITPISELDHALGGVIFRRTVQQRSLGALGSLDPQSRYAAATPWRREIGGTIVQIDLHPIDKQPARPA
jgi:hypothetical protein